MCRLNAALRTSTHWKLRLTTQSIHWVVLSLQAEYEVRVQLLEIYNEQLRDLLDCSRSGKRLDIRNTERSGLNVPDATQVPMCSLQGCEHILCSL